MSRSFVLLLLVGTMLSTPVLAVEDTTLPPVAPPPLIDDVTKSGVVVEPPSAEMLNAPSAAAVAEPAPATAAEVVAPIVGDAPAAATAAAPVVVSPSAPVSSVEVGPEPVAQAVPAADTPKRVKKSTTTAARQAKKDDFVYPKFADTRAKAMSGKTAVTSEALSGKQAKDIGVSEVMPVAMDTMVEEQTMPFTAVLREAYLFNPDLRAMRARTKAVFEQLPQAMAYFQPNVTASAGVDYTNTSTDTSVESEGTEKTAGLDLTQPLYRGGRTLAQIRAADARVDAQLATLADTERTVLYNAAAAYMDVMKTQATMNVNVKNRDVIARQLQATRDRFRVGDVTRTDVSQSEFRLASAEADLTAATGAYRSARAVFEQIVGVEASDVLDAPQSVFTLPTSLESATYASETYHPLVIAAKAQERAAQSDVDVEAGALLPNVALNAGLSATRDAISSAYNESDTGRIGVSLSMPLYEGGATRSRIREAKYTANELYLKILSARRAAREETVRAWENLAAARAEYTSRQAQVRAATIARDGVRQEAELGQRTILDALDADTELRDAQIAEITAQRNQVVAEFALASAVGQLVPGNVGIAEQVFNPDEVRSRALTSVLSTGVEKEPEDGR